MPSAPPRFGKFHAVNLDFSSGLFASLSFATRQSCLTLTFFCFPWGRQLSKKRQQPNVSGLREASARPCLLRALSGFKGF